MGASLKFGLAIGKNASPQPVLLITSFDFFKECFALGSGSLVNARLQISLEKMTCNDANYFYEYDLKSALVTDDMGQLGIQTRHYPSSQSLKNSITGLKDLYSKIDYTEGLKLIADAELGHWDVEPGAPVQINFVVTPVLIRKISINR